MEELWEELNPTPHKVFHKPKFPTRRWGQSFTKDSTTCKTSIKRMIDHYAKKGIRARKRKDEFATNKFNKHLGVFYHIEIQIEP